MKLNRTGSNWNRLERNKINENWDIIEGSYNDVVGQITDEVVGHLIDSAKLDWKEPVDTVEDLPASAEVGETRMVREADPDGVSYVYRYDGEKWEKIQAIDVTLVNEVDRRLTAQLADIATQVKSTGEDDTLAINEAIDYVHNNGGGQVLLVDPIYNYSGDIHIKESVELKGTEKVTLKNTATENARIIFYSIAQLKNISFDISGDYNDSMFLLANEYLTSVDRKDTSTSNAKVFFEKIKAVTPFNPNTPNKVAVELFSTRSDIANATSAGFWGVTGKDSYLQGFNTMFLLESEETGWINGNKFDITINEFEHAVRVKRSEKSLGIDKNIFNLNMQTGEMTKDIFIDGGTSNDYSGCTIWDMESYTEARVGTGVIKNNMNGVAVPKERYAQFLRRRKYHLLGRFEKFTSYVNNVLLSLTGHSNMKTEILIRGNDEKIERRIYGSDRLLSDIKFFKRHLTDGEVEIYMYNDSDVELECNIYIEGFRSFYPSPQVTYENVDGLVEMTNIDNYYPNIQGMYERGSNENGTWVKYADGTMICRKTIPSNLKTTNPSGSMFVSENVTWVFPQPFATANDLFVGVFPTLFNRTGGVTATPTLGSCRYNVMSTVSSESTEGNILLVAIGSWR